MVQTHLQKGRGRIGSCRHTSTFCKDAPRHPSLKKVGWTAVVIPDFAAVYSEMPFPTCPHPRPSSASLSVLQAMALQRCTLLMGFRGVSNSSWKKPDHVCSVLFVGSAWLGSLPCKWVGPKSTNRGANVSWINSRKKKTQWMSPANAISDPQLHN